MSKDQKRLDDLLVDLREKFSVLLNGRIEKLLEAYRHCRNGAPAGAAMESIRFIHEETHKLAGSGGVYGFSEVSAISRRIETLCSHWLEENRLPDAKKLNQLGELLETMRAEIHPEDT